MLANPAHILAQFAYLIQFAQHVKVALFSTIMFVKTIAQQDCIQYQTLMVVNTVKHALNNVLAA